VARFDFVSEDYLVKPYVKGVQWFGRHFTICSSQTKTKKRQYTTVLSLTPNAISYRSQLLQLVEYKGESTPGQLAMTSQSEQPQLSLFIKHYPQFPDGFSNFIHNALDQNSRGFTIEGPIGEGLGLRRVNNEGDHYLFCAGTGILPCLDFLNYYLEYIVYLTRLDEGPAAAKEANPKGEDFSKVFSQSFTVTFCGSFVNRQEFLGEDIIEGLTKLTSNPKFGNLFRCYVRFDSLEVPSFGNTVQAFDLGLIQSMLGHHTERVLICGPPGFNNALSNNVQTAGVPANRIHFV
jgi:NAD(P)H-flavin reductase